MSIYERLGIAPVINAWGTVTALGGSLMPPEVLVAMIEASQSFVDLHELQRAAGESIARLLGVPAACVTSGAAAGLTIAAASCMAGSDPELRGRLPDTAGMRNECMVLRGHRSVYDQAVRASGMRMREVAATRADIRSALSRNTAMFLYLAESELADESLPLAEVREAIGGWDIPLVVDAAAELPPIGMIARQFAAGADLVAISGGKELRGPQASGLLLGDARLIERCAAIAFPNHGIGRGMKTGKEIIAGLVVAVELFAARDEFAVAAARSQVVDQLVAGLADVAGVDARRGFPTRPGIQPAGIPRAYARSAQVPAELLRSRLRASTPSIAVGVDGDEIVLSPQCLSADDVPAVIRGILLSSRVAIG